MSEKSEKDIIHDFSEYLAQPEGEIKSGNEAFNDPPIVEVIRYFSNHHDRLNHFLKQFSSKLAKITPYHAARLALICGTMVEWGGNAEVIADDMIQLIIVHFDSAKNYINNNNDKNGHTAFDTLHYIVMAGMTVLSRVKSARIKARSDKKLLEIVSFVHEHFDYAYYLDNLFSSVDDCEITIIDPVKKFGILISTVAVYNNFHFMTLLQGLLIEKYPDYFPELIGKQDQNITDIARGQKSLTEHSEQDNSDIHEDNNTNDMNCSALLGYYPVSSLPVIMDENQEDSTNAVDSLIFLPGELTPLSIPEHNKQKIILLGKKALAARKWETSFIAPLHEALHPDLIVKKEFNSHEIDNIIEEIKKSN